MPIIDATARRRVAHDQEATLTALLILQGFVTFVAVPVAAIRPAGHLLLDISRILFAAVRSFALTKRRLARVVLLVVLGVPGGAHAIFHDFGLTRGALHQVVSLTTFVLTTLVTGLVIYRLFGPGQVTVHRVQGAIFVYLNVAVLFAIAFDLLEMYHPGAVHSIAGGLIATVPAQRLAETAYFSMTTITGTGYGDLVPVHPFARSLANLEATFGLLFPATFVARFVALHLAHSDAGRRNHN
jgi:Ion channel